MPSSIDCSNITVKTLIESNNRSCRLLNVIAVAGTAYTAIYIVAVAFEHGFQSAAVDLGPHTFTSFFAGECIKILLSQL